MRASRLRRSLVAGAVVALALGALPATAMPRATRGECGVWRCDVKTLSDAQAHDVIFDRLGPTVRSMSDGTRPYPWREQEKRQRRRTGKVGAFTVAAAIGPVAVASTLGRLRDRTRQHRPTGRWWPRGPPPRLTLLDLRTGGRTPLAENLAGSFSYVASPDGTRLARKLHRASRVDV